MVSIDVGAAACAHAPKRSHAFRLGLLGAVRVIGARSHGRESTASTRRLAGIPKIAREKAEVDHVDLAVSIHVRLPTEGLGSTQPVIGKDLRIVVIHSKVAIEISRVNRR